MNITNKLREKISDLVLTYNDDNSFEGSSTEKLKSSILHINNIITNSMRKNYDRFSRVIGNNYTDMFSLPTDSYHRSKYWKSLEEILNIAGHPVETDSEGNQTKFDVMENMDVDGLLINTYCPYEMIYYYTSDLRAGERLRPDNLQNIMKFINNNDPSDSMHIHEELALLIRGNIRLFDDVNKLYNDATDQNSDISFARVLSSLMNLDISFSSTPSKFEEETFWFSMFQFSRLRNSGLTHLPMRVREYSRDELIAAAMTNININEHMDSTPTIDEDDYSAKQFAQNIKIIQYLNERNIPEIMKLRENAELSDQLISYFALNDPMSMRSSKHATMKLASLIAGFEPDDIMKPIDINQIETTNPVSYYKMDHDIVTENIMGPNNEVKTYEAYKFMNYGVVPQDLTELEQIMTNGARTLIEMINGKQKNSKSVMFVRRALESEIPLFNPSEKQREEE